MNASLSAKPGYLPLRVASGGLLNGLAGFFHFQAAVQDRAHFAIADKAERLGIFIQAAAQHGPHFVEPATLNHGLRPGVNAFIQFLAWWLQANLQRPPALQRNASRPMNFR